MTSLMRPEGMYLSTFSTLSPCGSTKATPWPAWMSCTMIYTCLRRSSCLMPKATSLLRKLVLAKTLMCSRVSIKLERGDGQFRRRLDLGHLHPGDVRDFHFQSLREVDHRSQG